MSNHTVTNHHQDVVHDHNIDEYELYRQLQVPLPTKWRGGKLNRWSWKFHGRLLPFMHWGDTIAVPDMYVNLRVLWCKALSSFHPHSPAVYEGGSSANNNNNSSCSNNCNHFVTYRMLPPWTRWPLKYGWWIFPRWMHANIELRTAYLNQIITQELKRLQADHRHYQQKICILVLGGGYDPRGAKLLMSPSLPVDRVYELDLPTVVQSKQALLDRAYRDHDTWAQQKKNHFCGKAVDLNDNVAVDRVLDEIGKELQQDGKDFSGWYTIVISEAIFLYLQPGVASRILQRISIQFGNNNNIGGGASFAFADRLDLDSDITADSEPGDGMETTVQSRIQKWLLKNGWTLQDFKSKTGATKHLGLATAI
jgi:O-methyltransferase involved in polyketide biosynthesis